MTESKHTPLQLREHAPEVGGEVDQNYRSIAAGPGYMPDENPDGGFCLTGIISPANAAYFVKSWNAYPQLVEALKKYQKYNGIHNDLDAELYECGESALRAAGEEL